MVKEEGVIEKIFEEKARVRVQKSSACASCGSRDSCHVMGDSEMMIEVANELHAGVGDYVELSVPTGSLLKLSLLVYLLPVVALIVGAYLGGLWAESLPISSTPASILGGCVAMGLTFWGLKWFDSTIGNRDQYHPRITRILMASGSPGTVTGNRSE